MNALEVASNLSIIILAISSIAVLVILAILLIQIIRLIKMLRNEVVPMLEAIQETLGTVRGTATFVGDHMVQPVVRMSSYAAGFRGAVGALFGKKSKNGQA